jgi:hypothetical protein
MDMVELIKIYDSKLTDTFCKQLIDLFELPDTLKLPGKVGPKLNINANLKHTLEYKIQSTISPESQWYGIDSVINSILSPTINDYIAEINTNIPFIRHNELVDTGFQIQKYKANEGHYKAYHNDFAIFDENPEYYRILTFIFYLNDVDEGGETEFWGKYKVKPVTGRLVIFPASWTYPHCGLMPISHDKYIITGWIYARYK